MTIVQMFAYEDGHLTGGYSPQNFIEVRTNIRLAMLCVEICLRNIACMSIFYNTVSKACRLHSNVFYNSATFISESGWHYYRAVGDPKCDVYSGFVHQRGVGLCYRAESNTLTKTLADSACAAQSSGLAIVDSEQKQTVVVGTLNLLSTVTPPSQSSDPLPVLNGCYSISDVDNLSLEFTDLSLTVQKCFDKCHALGRSHTMLEVQTKCYCGDLKITATKLSDSLCNKICSDGNYCGNLLGMFATYDHQSNLAPGFVGFYIGAIMDNSTSQWTWRDSNIVVYDSFDLEDDSPLSETCVLMAAPASYKWYSEACTYTAGYVCEVDL